LSRQVNYELAASLVFVTHASHVVATGRHVAIATGSIFHFFYQMPHFIDSLTRVAGEEFVVLVPETFIEGAHSLAVRLRDAIAPETSIRLTISIGVAAFPQDADSKEALIAAADSALYLAKQNGRNCVCTYA
jgi:PleD family two-component response regulator